MRSRSFLLFALVSLLPASLRAETSLLVSIPDQKLIVLENGLRTGQFPVSTSKFGLGDRRSSYSTPLGSLSVSEKIGGGAPAGSVFKGRRRTGEVLRPNAKGRDPVVTRILWLRGLEARNSQAHSRGIYIHGTPQERLIGRPASYGCIRMRSSDVMKVYAATPVGAHVEIVNTSAGSALREFAAN